jgi:hypothetical protein
MSNTSSITKAVEDETVFTWTITNLEVMPEYKNMTNVVKNVFYTYTGVYQSYSSSITGVMELNKPDVIDFVDYYSLTENEVIEWICSKINLDSFKNNIQENIQQQVQPELPTFFGLPWQDPSGNIIQDPSGNIIQDPSGNIIQDPSGNII